jgi:hypothetical protein
MKLTSGVSYSWLYDTAEVTFRGISQKARNVASQRSVSARGPNPGVPGFEYPVGQSGVVREVEP